MLDRIDIDALLIGSLYGELSSADEARLKAHLESHPADRTALEGLSRTRAAVRTSRIFEVQREPPQSVSALLLQEAVRRAPRRAQKAHEEEREGWFARLRRSLLVHPAMAAATMLVLVLGVAGTLYLRKGDHFANPDLAGPSEVASSHGGAAAEQAPTGSSFAAPPAAPAPAPAPAPAVPAAPTATAALTPPAPATEPKADPPRSDFARAPRDQDSYRVGVAEGTDVPAPAAKPDPAPAKPAKPTEQKKAARMGGILEVTTPQRTPKELDDEERPAVAVKGRAQSPDAAKDHRAADAAPGAAPPAAAGPSAQGMAKAPPSGGAASGFGGAEDKLGKADPELAWARDQHSRLIGQVRAGRCPDAAGTAVALSNRAPGYYQQNVENDRSVKECLAYINAERERAAERAQRARAATARRATEESAPAAAKQAASQKKAAPAKAAAGKADSAADAPAAAPADSATKR